MNILQFKNELNFEFSDDNDLMQKLRKFYEQHDISFAASDEDYIKQTEGFLFNPNRLNVMISRAKTKVIIFASEIIWKGISFSI